MAKKQLIQVVRELSVGMDTIYDHLVAKGFELEKKPNAKLTDDMYDAVLVEFQSDLAIKNKAEQMSLGPKPMPKKKSSKLLNRLRKLLLKNLKKRNLAKKSIATNLRW